MLYGLIASASQNILKQVKSYGPAVHHIVSSFESVPSDLIINVMDTLSQWVLEEINDRYLLGQKGYQKSQTPVDSSCKSQKKPTK